jgi:hypothetical protein
MLYSAFWCLGGTIFTVADIGYIFWGAIVFGGAQFFGGLIGYFLVKNAERTIEKIQNNQ